MEMQNTYEKVRQWAHARNLINGSTPKDQTLKLMSEFGEIIGANTAEEERDGFGDCLVVMTILAAMYGCNLEDLTSENEADYGPFMVELGKLADLVLKGQFALVPAQLALCHFSLIEECEDGVGYSSIQCFADSYNEIKDRTGIMYNGAFIKSTDPAYVGAVAAVEAGRNAA